MKYFTLKISPKNQEIFKARHETYTFFIISYFTYTFNYVCKSLKLIEDI